MAFFWLLFPIGFLLLSAHVFFNCIMGICSSISYCLETLNRWTTWILGSSTTLEGEEDNSQESSKTPAKRDIDDPGQEPAKFSSSMKVDASLLRFVFGKGGNTKLKIERETNAQLYIPRPHEAKAGFPVVIKGHSHMAVSAAVAEIQTVLDEAVKSPQLNYSHFISLPLAVHPALVEKITEFRDSVLSMGGKNCELEQPQYKNTLALESNRENIEELEVEAEKRSRSENRSGIDISIFVKPNTFHLTVLMLKLWNDDRVEAATEILQKVQPKVHEALEGRSVAVRLQGLECMKGSPEKAHVLHVRVQEADGGNRLAQACQAIIDEYIKAGFVFESDIKQELKLHATLMNTTHRSRKGNYRKRIPFDARKILQKHGKDDWGEHQILEAHLSQRFSYSESGYYYCCGSIGFPTSEDKASKKNL